RLGFVVGLMRPDVDFIGYEFVQHRVDGATAMVKNFSIEKHVHFYTQDLSSREFQIPDAEIYYMYDPFSHETYEYILSQLIKISHRRKIIIATKGNARQPLMEVSARLGWPPPQEYDHGNLCLFSST
nr:SAM-dependent methyltransferase [Pseudobdellovibrionaceae bacterium]